MRGALKQSFLCITQTREQTQIIIVTVSRISSKSVTKRTKIQKLKQQKVRRNAPDIQVRARKLAMLEFGATNT
jgi:hypothetical protein